MTEMHERAAELLIAIWRGVPADYKSRYRASIWQQFEDNVRSAAYTSNLGKFVNSLCAKLQAQIKSNNVKESEKILNSGQDKELLKLLRDETTLLVLMVRLANQERQDEWRAKQEEIEEQEQAMDDSLFALPKTDLVNKRRSEMPGIKIVDGKAQFDYDENGMLSSELVADIEDFIRVTNGTREDYLELVTKEIE